MYDSDHDTESDGNETTTAVSYETRNAVSNSRRRLLGKAAATAAIAATATAVAGRSARADNGEPILIGQENTGTGTPTQLIGVAFETNSALEGSTVNGALGRRVPIPSGGSLPTGVWALTQGTTPSRAVWGQDQTEDGIGVYGQHSDVGLGPGTGVVAKSFNGIGIRAEGTDVDARFAGTSVVEFSDSTPIGPGSPGRAGMLGRSTDGSLWYAVADNSWQRIAGPATAGGFVPIEPTRVYDSRVPLPLTGILATGQNRVISVADGRDLDSGAVTETAIVPVGARAVAYNLTVDGAVGKGFLSVTPGTSTTFKSSAINWGPLTTVVANAGIVTVDADRQIRVFCGGVDAAAAFIVDITGYYV